MRKIQLRRLAGPILAAMALSAGSAIAGPIFTDYETFYAAQANAVFGEPLPRDPYILYADRREPGLYVEIETTVKKKPVVITVRSTRIAVNGQTYRFARATAFPNETPSEIYPGTANVYLTARRGRRGAMLCVDGSGHGSGEASRHTQIYLLINPWGPRRNATFLQLPSLLSSCRAVMEDELRQPIFPRNTYLHDSADKARIGLHMSYYRYDGKRFVLAGVRRRITFADPEIPFRFYAAPPARDLSDPANRNAH